MHLGKFVFAQIVEFIPRFEFEKCVKRYKGDFHAKSLNSYNHLLQLIFGQITACTSLREFACASKRIKTISTTLELGSRSTNQVYPEPTKS